MWPTCKGSRPVSDVPPRLFAIEPHALAVPPRGRKFGSTITAQLVAAVITLVEAMKVAYIDCFSGVAGDMLLAALIDAVSFEIHTFKWLSNNGRTTLSYMNVTICRLVVSGRIRDDVCCEYYYVRPPTMVGDVERCSLHPCIRSIYSSMTKIPSECFGVCHLLTGSISLSEGFDGPSSVCCCMHTIFCAPSSSCYVSFFYAT